MKKFSKEIQIALVAVVGIIVLYFGLQFLKGMTLFSTDNRYFVKFQDVSGLSVASPIFANGYRVGVVETIEFNWAMWPMALWLPAIPLPVDSRWVPWVRLLI